MKILLAGYNIDTEILKGHNIDATPETISAAYARISRSPKPVDELRKIARGEIEQARRSNKNIIFNMGHHSVAEHSVFNFDIIDVSRLAIEYIERFRLCSYTEKSQRYIKLGSGFVIPEEIKWTKLEEKFVNIVNIQNNFYKKLYNELKSYIRKISGKFVYIRDLENKANEDARYTVSLTTYGQLGATINARNLELLIRRFASCKLSEIRKIGKKIYSLVEKVAPSIILFTERSPYDEKTYDEIAQQLTVNSQQLTVNGQDVKLIEFTQDADEVLISSLIHTSSNLPYNRCKKIAKSMSFEKKKELIKTTYKYARFYDAMLREFEYVNLTYELIISASCFAQLKRHRMATITTQDYNPELGVTIPESIYKIGMDKDFEKIIEKTDDIYYSIRKEIPEVSPYVLTNAHRRRVLIRVNARELYHISRLREDESAQWDIRNKAKAMSDLAKKVMPLTCLFLGGKDKYDYLLC